MRIEACDQVGEAVAAEGFLEDGGEFGVTVGDVLLLPVARLLLKANDHLPQEEEGLVYFDRLLAQPAHRTEYSFGACQVDKESVSDAIVVLLVLVLHAHDEDGVGAGGVVMDFVAGHYSALVALSPRPQHVGRLRTLLLSEVLYHELPLDFPPHPQSPLAAQISVEHIANPLVVDLYEGALDDCGGGLIGVDVCDGSLDDALVVGVAFEGKGLP